jgi:hypothetical protein
VNAPLSLTAAMAAEWHAWFPKLRRPIFFASPRPAEQEALTLRCVAWLKRHDPKGYLLRKTIEHEARLHFGKALTTRIFAAAYKRTYNRKRERRTKLQINTRPPSI